MKNIIIDADPGVDDTFALLMAAKSNQLNIDGICTVAGNCDLENATKNAFKALDLVNRNDIKVYKGMSHPINGNNEDATYVHGNNGMGGIVYTPINRNPENLHAVDYLIEAVNNNQDIILVALGPLTNIACAIKRDSAFLKKVKSLVIMGGAINEGNVTDFAEFNFYKDPEAAKIVFDSDYNEIIMLGLDVTRKLTLNDKLETILKNSDNKLANFLYDISRKGAEFDRKEGYDGLIINDPITIFAITNPDYIKLHTAKISIETEGKQRGRSIVKLINENSNCKVGYLIDSEEFYKIFFKRVLDIDI